MKSGVKTTEFWITLVLVVLGAVLAAGLLPEDSAAARIVGAILAAAASFGYSVSRGLAKQKNPT